MSSSVLQTAVGLCGEERNMPTPRQEGIIKNKLERSMCVCGGEGGGEEGGCMHARHMNPTEALIFLCTSETTVEFQRHMSNSTCPFCVTVTKAKAYRNW